MQSMRCDKNTMLLYAVTDRGWTGTRSLYEQVEEALQGGVTCVQLREKESDDAAFLEEAKKIGGLCRRYSVPFLVNDNVEIALQCDADGVHVGQEDMAAADVRRRLGENRILGVSVHSVEEGLEAVRNGADYLGVGAVFATSTKRDVSVLPLETVQAICKVVSVPVVAIGGIGRNNIHQLAGSGVDGVALVSAIFSAEDIKGECHRLRRLSERMVQV